LYGQQTILVRKLKYIVVKEEGRFVWASTILKKKYENQMTNGEFAILYRTNAQSRAMEDVQTRYSISYLWIVFYQGRN
jgi:superfamily I DNA/RNA helicase